MITVISKIRKMELIVMEMLDKGTIATVHHRAINAHARKKTSQKKEKPLNCATIITLTLVKANTSMERTNGAKIQNQFGTK